METEANTPEKLFSPHLPLSFAKILREEFVCSLATVDEKGLPWACNCYYAFLEEPNARLVFASALHTKHVRNFLQQPVVAATVAHAAFEPTEIRGLQLLGTVEALDAGDEKARASYLQRFSYAGKMAALQLWNFSIQYAKLTDNRVCFGYKQIWEYVQ